ncbi:sn-glycerol-3-phosphate ABC transporter ATP-binding protein UgpC [Rhodococcus sp. WS1]|jgi:sn-glycerol 3-phosphate transport system ATP-binding protein|uniref:Trehalose import ATP-binding protein SugC n=2 Tax=Rhodococcus erythropolis TaxID=1833 RepID=A0A0C2WAC7_RHOER|nr:MULTISPECIES: sn-glycerol-3-phosphate ABC transporter ATP-binding protein UgpC [Rhodococcus]MCD2152784.1 sn-glycerol-3-phosphate ABC transporter ATP-binding protein UgpC [Rhodococcus cerastii]AKD99385.1 ABC transporter ATPase [Rhodococcus erythropolis]ALU69251.1 ABC transporter ATPase [Rhodococcus erythropolis R138]ATI31559.1 sugar ABC transporter ATP-binding protein [Rhodococcus sp. H-CA8f]KAB2582385.1 sugar ABC transporter ATP-binding protein [Rhodococcus erythropolis]
MANVQFAGVTHRYEGTDRPAVDRLDLDIADGEFLVLVGPSGCGKSTSLRMLAGLESASDGRIEIGGTDVTHLAPRARDVAMVFQSYALYPNMTVEQNMGFALQNAGVGKSERRERVLEAARMLELEPLLGRKPAKLSGGQRQRVAMGRAIVRHPKVFCMDEPLSNLDAKLRVSTRSQIAALQRRLGTTTVYVTHDQVEAMTMGDRVAVMLDGRLQQVAKPRELYDNPVNTFVAAFIGSPGMNLIEAPVEGTVAVLGDLRIPLPTGASERERVVVGVRPESWDLVGAWRKGSLAVDADLLEELGAESFVYAKGAPDSQWQSRSGRIVIRVDRKMSVAPGESLHLLPKAGEVYFFSAETGVRL